MRIQLIKYSLALLFHFPFVGFAKNLTLNEALETFLKNNPEVQELQERVRQKELAKGLARAKIFPTLSLGVSAGTSKASGARSSSSTSSSAPTALDTYQASLDLYQPLYQSGALLAGLEYAEKEIQKARWEMLSLEQQLIAQVVELFLTTQSAQLKLTEAEFNAEILKNYLNITKRYEKIGRTRITDRMQAQINYTDSLIELETLRQSKEEKILELLSFLGNTEGNIEAVLLPKKIPEIELPPEDQAIKISLNRLGEFKINELQVQINQKAKELDLSQDGPSLAFVASIGAFSYDRPSWFESESSAYSAGLKLNWPLFSGFSSVAKKQSYVSKEVSLKMKRRELELKTEQEVRSLIRAIKLYDSLLNEQKKSSLEAHSALKLMLKGYENGTASSTDIVQMQRTRFEAARRYIDLQLKYLVSVLKLRRLLGIDLKKVYLEGLQN